MGRWRASARAISSRKAGGTLPGRNWETMCTARPEEPSGLHGARKRSCIMRRRCDERSPSASFCLPRGAAGAAPV